MRAAVQPALVCGLVLTIGLGSATRLAAQTDHFKDLTPLLTLFGPDGPDLGYDVAGIRCAALYYAQYEYSKTHGDVRPPSKKKLAAGERFLAASAATRDAAGMSLAKATTSTEKDARRTIAAYIERFDANVAANKPAWKGDRLIEGDLNYCKVLER